MIFHRSSRKRHPGSCRLLRLRWISPTGGIAAGNGFFSASQHCTVLPWEVVCSAASFACSSSRGAPLIPRNTSTTKIPCKEIWFLMVFICVCKESCVCICLYTVYPHLVAWQKFDWCTTLAEAYPGPWGNQICLAWKPTINRALNGTIICKWHNFDRLVVDCQRLNPRFSKYYQVK